MNRLDAGCGNMTQADLHRWQGQVVDRAILEASFVRQQVMPATALHGRDTDRAASEPGPAQLPKRRFARQQAADPGWVAEDFVERQCYEIGMPAAQIEPVGRREGRSIEQHIPAALL